MSELSTRTRVRIARQEDGKHFLGTFWQKLCFSIPLRPAASLRVRKMVFRGPENCAWRSGVKMMLSYPSCQREAKLGQPCRRGQAWLFVPPSAFFLSLSQHHSHLGGARGADLLGKLDH